MNISLCIDHTTKSNVPPAPSFDSANEEDLCCICLEGMAGSRSVSISSCAHRYHTECIDPWLKKHQDCPFRCRQIVIISIFDADEPPIFQKITFDGLDDIDRQNVNTRNKHGITLLQFALINNMPANIIDALIDKGADIHAGDQKNLTALHHAAKAENVHEDVIKKLIERGADPNAKDEFGNTPLNYAVASSSKFEVVDALIRNGADVNARDREGKTILESSYNVLKNPNDLRVEVIRAFADAGFDINASVTPDRKTIIQLAVFCDDWSTVDHLRVKGANINSRDKNGVTALHYAAKMCTNDQLIYISKLITRKADPNAKDKHKKTPLHYAVAKGQIDIVNALKNSGADPNAKDKDNKTPLDYATANNQEDIMNALNTQGGCFRCTII